MEKYLVQTKFKGKIFFVGTAYENITQRINSTTRLFKTNISQATVYSS